MIDDVFVFDCVIHAYNLAGTRTLCTGEVIGPGDYVFEPSGNTDWWRVTGEEDIVIPPAAVAVLASIVPGARLARVPQAGHSVYWERPQIFNRLVDELLRDVDRAP